MKTTAELVLAAGRGRGGGQRLLPVYPVSPQKTASSDSGVENWQEVLEDPPGGKGSILVPLSYSLIGISRKNYRNIFPKMIYHIRIFTKYSIRYQQYTGILLTILGKE